MRRWLVPFAVLVIAVAAAVVVWQLTPTPQSAQSPSSQGQVLIGGPFTLTDQTGKRVTDRDFRGRLMLVYFGYTYCPDVCPLGLQTVSAALDQLSPEEQRQIAPLFVTVDPARDTVPVMRDYLQSFHPALIGLTGSEQEITHVLRAYRVYARKAESRAGDDAYLVDHSTFTYLMDRQGAYLAHFGPNATPDEIAKRLGEAVRGG